MNVYFQLYLKKQAEIETDFGFRAYVHNEHSY
jgi:hypothetical protein